MTRTATKTKASAYRRNSWNCGIVTGNQQVVLTLPEEELTGVSEQDVSLIPRGVGVQQADEELVLLTRKGGVRRKLLGEILLLQS